MGLEIEAVYENGVLKLERQVPLEIGQRVRLTIHPPGGRVRKGYGMMGSNLSPKEIERIAEDPGHPGEPMTFENIAAGSARWTRCAVSLG